MMVKLKSIKLYVSFKMYLKKLNEKNSIIYLIALATLILLIPHLTRFFVYDNALMGFDTYYHARISETIANQGVQDYDSLSYGGSEYMFNPYHFVLAALSSIITLDVLLRLLPFILGILSFILFYSILKRLKLELKIRFLTGMLFIISPIFIYFFTIPNQHSVPFFLNLLAFYFLLSKERYFIISILSFILLPLFGLSHVIVGFLAILSYCLSNKKAIPKFTALSIILLISSLIKYVPFYSKYPFPHLPSFINFTIFNSFISDFGAPIAFGIFTLFLSLLGLITIKKSYQNIIFYFLSALLLISSYYFIHLRIYINLLFAFLVANAILIFIKRRWELNLIKQLTLLAIICGLLFSTVSYINRISNIGPNAETISSLEWLHNQPNGVVFSHYEKGFWIETIANKPVIMDGLFDYAPEVEQRYNDSIIIFNSRNLKTTTQILDKYNITYIWIDKKMMSGQVWGKETQGLLFILKNSERFKSIYDLDGVEIWTYIK